MAYDIKQIKAAAASAGMTLTELAAEIGVTRASLYAYVSGAVQPSDERIHQIAQATHQPLGYFALARVDTDKQVGGLMAIVESMLATSRLEDASEFAETNWQLFGSREQALILLNLANGHAGLGRIQEAIPFCQRAKDHFEALGERHSMGRCLQTMGYCYAHLGPLRRAQLCFAEAGNLLDAEMRWKPLLARAAICERRGDFAGARDLIGDVEQNHVEPLTRLYALGARADLAAKQGDWRAANALEREAFELAVSLGAKDQIAERQVGQATCALMLDSPDTDAVFERGRGFFDAYSDQARLALFNLARAALEAKRRNFGDARRLSEHSLNEAISGELRRVEAQAYLRLAEVAMDQGVFVQAQTEAMRAKSCAIAHEYETEWNHAAALSAFCAVKCGDLDAASRELEELATRDTWRRSIHIREIVSFTRKLLSDRHARTDDLLEAFRVFGIAYAPGFGYRDGSV